MRSFSKKQVFILAPLLVVFLFNATSQITSAQVPNNSGQLGSCEFNGGDRGWRTVETETEQACRTRAGSNFGSTYRWSPLSAEQLQAREEASESWGSPTSWIIDKTIEPAFSFLVYTTLKFVSLLTGISAILLNGVVYYTVVKVSDNYANLAPLNEVWRVIRDIANMTFIFVLLYAAIQTITGGGKNIQKLVVNIVIVGVLMNFSLFFTKVIIDTSNVLALTFYDAISPGSLNAAGETTIKGVLGQAGLATAFTKHLELQNLYNVASTLDTGAVITVGIMGSIMLLIAAFVFFAIAIMFVIRYVVLLLVLILSPIAFVAYALADVGQLQKYKDQWWAALINQAFFAPVYFMMTWISLKLLDGIMAAFSEDGQVSSVSAEALKGLSMGQTGADVTTGAFLMFMNFTIVIVLLIASLTTAKDMANKAGGGINKLTGWAMGAAGGATLGVTGKLGRNIIGSRAATMVNDENLKRRAAQGSVAAKLQLAAAGRASKASFDLRGSRFGDNLEAGKAPKGGFVEDQKNRTKAYAAYKPSDGAKKGAAEEAKKAKETLEETRRRAAERAITAIPVSASLKNAERELETARAEAARGVTFAGLSDEDKAASEARMEDRVKAAEEKVKKEKERRDAEIAAYTERESAAQKEAYEKASDKDLELSTRMERMAKKLEDSKFPGFILSNKDKAKAIRAAGKEKSVTEKLAEAAAAKAKEDAEASGEAEKPKDAGTEEKKS